MAKLDANEFSELIDLIYSAATDSSQWTHVTQALGKAFDAPYILIFGLNPSTADVLYAASSGLSADSLKQYEQTYSALDIRAPRALRAPAGSIFTDGTMVDRHTYRASPKILLGANSRNEEIADRLPMNRRSPPAAACARVAITARLRRHFSLLGSYQTASMLLPSGSCTNAA